MKRFVMAVMALFGALAIHATAAQARVQISIDLSSQRMTVILTTLPPGTTGNAEVAG